MPDGSEGQMMEGDAGEQWTATGVSARFIRGCKHPGNYGRDLSGATSSQSPWKLGLGIGTPYL